MWHDSDATLEALPRETLYWLRLLSVSEIVPAAKLEPLIQEAHELVAILTTIVKKTKAQKST